MSVHTYHDDLPGFDARQLLHDGCPECEWRGKHVTRALAYLDVPSFQRAWVRARQFNVNSTGLAVSRAEAPLLQVLGMIQIAAERSGLALMNPRTGHIL